MRKIVIAVAALMLVAGVALAQGFSLQVGESAAAMGQGALRVSAGANVGDEVMFYGGRVGYAPMEGLQVFADGGLADSDTMDSAMSIQGGAIYTLPVQMPVDLAVRGAIAKPFFDDIEMPSYTYYGETFGGGTVSVDVMIMSIMALASKDMGDQMPGLTVYGGAGFARLSVSVGDADDSETDLALAAGGIYKVTDQLSVFGELSYVDDPFFGGGVRFDM